jgi:transposase-like protein
VVTALERRRQWSEEQRAAIVSETMQPGATVLAVARKYDVHPRCIFRWKQKLLATNALVEVPAPVSATLPSAPQKKRRGRPRKQIPPPTAVPAPRVFAVEPAPPVAAIVPSDSVRLVVGDLVIAISTVKGL